MDDKILALIFDVDGSIMSQGGLMCEDVSSMFRKLYKSDLLIGPATGKDARYCRGLGSGAGACWDFISAETGGQFLKLISEDPVTFEPYYSVVEVSDLSEFQRIIQYEPFQRTFTHYHCKPVNFRTDLKDCIISLFPSGTDIESTKPWVKYFNAIIKAHHLALKVQRHSDGCVDVLPITISKLLSIKHVSMAFSIETNNILTVVDGVNDIELTQGGVKSIAVGNANSAIKNEVQKNDGYIATSKYGEGFLEGLKHFAGKDCFSDEVNKIILG